MYISAVIRAINSQRVIDAYAQCSRCAVQDARRSDPARDLRAAVPRRRADRRGPDGPGRRLATGGLEASWRPQAGRAGARPPRWPSDALQRAARRPRPADRLDEPNGRLLAEPVRRPRRSPQTDGPM